MDTIDYDTHENTDIEMASWRWVDDELIYADPDNDELIPQQE